MLDKTHFYPNQNSREEIMLFLRQHWIAYAKWIAILSLLIFVPSLLFIFGNQGSALITNVQDRPFYTIAISIYILFIFALFLTSWIDYYLDVTIVSREHLISIKQNELFSRSIAEQSLLRVQDVSAKKVGLLQSVFNFGTVLVETAGEQPNFSMLNISDPEVVARTILQIHEELLQEYENDDNVSESLGLETIDHKNNNSHDDVKLPIEHPKPSKEEKDKINENNKENNCVCEDNVISIQKPQKSKLKDTSEKQTVSPEIIKISSQDNQSSRTVRNFANRIENKSEKNNVNDMEGELIEGEEIIL